MNSNIEKIIVPKDKNPLESIAEMGEKTKNAWIFLNDEAAEWLKKNAITITKWNGFTFNIGGRIVRVEHFNEWEVLAEITIGNGIYEFKELPKNPRRIYLVEMEA